jgi:DNA-binding NtrC family response regulator
MRLTALLLVSLEHQRPLMRHLNAVGFDPIVGSGHAEALQLLSFLPHIDVVFTDEQLPDGTWRQVVEDVTQRSPSTLVVICCQHCPSDEVWQDAATLGAYDLIADGTDELAIRTVVDAVLLQSRLRERRLRRIKPMRNAPPYIVEDSA